ncbi:hypothetical protein [Cryptosporangium minutisporangium]|uniref:hypothetical protein n=1 Tax=Cryptosporangium minutisporangium TaxID=113569 RepID=UPI00366DE49C
MGSREDGTLIEVQVELRGGPAGYTTVLAYRDNRHQLPSTVEVLVTGGILDYKLTSAVTDPDGRPIYRCPTNWRLAVRPAHPARTEPSPAAAVTVSTKEVDRLDALLAELDANDARRHAERGDPFAHPSRGATRK